MKQAIIISAVLLLSVGTTAFAAEKGVSKSSPGHEMQNSTSSTSKGASEYSPGDRMHDKGTTGKGASEYSSGDRMNDQRKK